MRTACMPASCLLATKASGYDLFPDWVFESCFQAHCPADSPASCRSIYFPTTLADWITTFVCGTSPIGPRVVVGVPSIFFTTSMPAITLPNTA